MKKIFTLLAAVLFGGAMFANAQTVISVTVEDDGSWYYPDYEDGNTYESKTVKSFNSNLEISEDGVYTLKNIFGSDNSISFTVGDYTGQKARLTYTGNVYVNSKYPSYPYFLDADGNYMDVTVELSDGSKMEVETLTGSQGSYSYLYKCTDEEVAEGYYQYYVYLSVYGWVGDYGEFDMYLVFGYDEPKSGVANVAVDADAPVEYYNLQGVKVANPSNGIFVRRQGSEVKKVIIK